MISIKALIVDDDAFIRTTLTAGLATYGIKVVASLSNGSMALKALENGNVEVAIVDLDLGPGPSGIDICNSLRAIKPELGLVLLTSYQDPRIYDPTGPSLPKGCRFLSKSELNDFKTLVDTVISASIKPFASTRTKTKSKNPLTDTQMEVLKMVAQGLSSIEIAEKRNVSVKAVENLISKIQKSVGIPRSKSINQRVKLARYYFSLTGKKPPGA